MKYAIYFVKLLLNNLYLPEGHKISGVPGAEALLDIV